MNQAVNRKYLIGLLFLFSFALYARTLSFGFVWDDERIHITNNQALMNGDIKSFWAKPYSGMYIPMTYTAWTFVKTIAVEKQVSPKAFHLLNILTNTVNVILVFMLLLILFKNQTQAFWGSLLFMLHPMQVESVAWISEFRGLYSVFFSLLSMIYVFKYLEKNIVFTIRNFITSKYFITASVFFVSALLSKPSAVVLPFVISVLTWCFYKENFKIVLKGLVLWLLFVIPILLVTRNSQPDESIYISIPFWERFFIAGNSLLFYLYKLLIPYPLAACYGNTPMLAVKDHFIYLSTFICVCLMIFSFIKRKSNPILFSSLFIIVIIVLPVSGLIPFEYQKHAGTADRYIYLGTLGAALLVPLIAAAIKKYSFLKYIFLSVFAIYLVLNIKQTNTWKNEFTVWDNTLQHYQNSAKVFYNHGVEYSKKGKFNEAVNDYSQSLSLEHNYKDALFNRANAYENLHDMNAAFNDYNTYLSIDSTDGSVYFKRAYLNYKTGNVSAAIADAEKAEELRFPVGAKFKRVLQEAGKMQNALPAIK